MIQPQKTTVRLYLVRHGETEWSLSGQHTSRTDIPLTEEGERQASGLGERLNETQFSGVFSSSRQRARRTYALAELNLEAEIESDLAEWDYGDYEGRRSADICGERPDWNLFRDGCPGGETPAHVSDRADGLIAHFRALEGNIAIFTHGQFGCALAARWIGLPVIEGQHFMFDPASISILGYEINHPTVPAILQWNATPAAIAPLNSISRIRKAAIPHPETLLDLNQYSKTLLAASA
jgi:broad specificity phosphatase PhoE